MIRSRYRGAPREWELRDPETGETHYVGVAYIHSSEEHRETAAARERALAKAEEQVRRVRNGLGARYDKTRKQVEQRIARIIGTEGEWWSKVHKRRRASATGGPPPVRWTRGC